MEQALFGRGGLQGLWDGGDGTLWGVGRAGAFQWRDGALYELALADEVIELEQVRGAGGLVWLVGHGFVGTVRDLAAWRGSTSTASARSWTSGCSMPIQADAAVPATPGEADPSARSADRAHGAG